LAQPQQAAGRMELAPALLQPQPDSPRDLASASLTQQASTPTGAGPPQQASVCFAGAAVVAVRAGFAPQQADAAAVVCSSSKWVMQTPVSGSVSSTRRAASQSPASAAATERTCS